MKVTAVDWAELPPEKILRKSERVTDSLQVDDKKRTASYFLKGKLVLELCYDFVHLEPKISNDLPLQAFLLSNYFTSKEMLISLKDGNSTLFKETFSVLFQSFRSVFPVAITGDNRTFRVSGITEQARTVFETLYDTKRLHASLYFLLPDRCMPECRADAPLALYKLSSEVTDVAIQVSEPIKELAVFLKEYRATINSAFSFVFYGHTHEEALQDKNVVFLASQFEQCFYLEEADTGISRGLYFF